MSKENMFSVSLGARFKLAMLRLARGLRLVGKDRFVHLRNYLLIEGSSLFDAAWYLDTYHDVARARVDPVWHYLTHGGAEGRCSGPNFDGADYLRKYNDVARARINPLVHYILCGKAEGRSCAKTKVPGDKGKVLSLALQQDISLVRSSRFFDHAWYMETYPESVAGGGDPVVHYCCQGWRKGFLPGLDFNGDLYLAANPDVRRAGVNPLVHYLRHGVRECRRLQPKAKAPAISDLELVKQSGLFDSDYYLRYNQDVKQGGVDPLVHFMKCGWREGRNPSSSFDLLYYVELNLPLFRKIGACNPLVHYLREGKSIGCKTCQSVFPRTLGISDVLKYAKDTDIDACRHQTVDFPGKIAVVVHLYYREMLKEFLSYLCNIEHPFDLFMTTLADDADRFRSEIENALPQCRMCKVIRCRNVGRDIGPFAVEVAKSLVDYDLVCKIHTKRDLLGTGWRTLILKNLLGSPAVVNSILFEFAQDEKLGMIFPKPPVSVQRSISMRGSWASNFEIAKAFASRAHIPDIGAADAEFGFPAGSMFWARPAALGKLLRFDFTYEDFDVPIGRDGSLAHAIERLFGLIPTLSGYGIKSILIAPPAPASVPKPYEPVSDAELRMRVNRYLSMRGKANRVAVYTAVVGGYDKITIPEELNPEIDYYYFSDHKLEGLSPWKWLPLDYHNVDVTRITRYYKLHPFLYFGKYEHVMWIDANIMIRKDIVLDLVAQHQDMGNPVSFMQHPERNCMYAEAEECMKAARDDQETIKRQMKRYQDLGVPANLGLPETGIYIVSTRDERARRVFAEWWHEIEEGSKRDQLSVMYAMYRQGCMYTPLFKNYDDSPRFGTKNFVYFLHKGKSNLTFPSVYRYPDFVREEEHPAGEGDYACLYDEMPSNPRLVVVVPVHNALPDVKNCLASLEPTLPQNAKVVIVNDGSDEPCAAYLHDYVAVRSRVFSLIHHPVGRGYTISINEAARSVDADYYVFLNSDTIVSPGWAEKLIRAAASLPNIGIVGPLSNAASWQTVPVLWENKAFCINALPNGVDVAEMNRACERLAPCGIYPKAQLINGFCYCVKASVFASIGYFDEENFPTGYGEEDDFSLRAVNAGFMLAFVPDAYVFHAKSKSFGHATRQKLVAENQKKFYAKHSRERVRRECKSLESHPVMTHMRAGLIEAFGEKE